MSVGFIEILKWTGFGFIWDLFIVDLFDINIFNILINGYFNYCLNLKF